MDDKVNGKIVLSILKFLRKEVESNTLSADACESVEVAIQCLESAYGCDASMEEGRIVPDLVELFCVSDVWTIPSNDSLLNEATPEARAEAEDYKNQGNNLMKEEKYDEAIKKYTNAIGLDSNNAVYFCNRAAAHSKLSNHQAAIEDCTRALELDPTYSKAYGRLGIAYSSLNQHEQARNSYLKALELEPDNESYKNNLNLTNEQITQQRGRTEGVGSSAATPGNAPFDLSAIFNPSLMNMASYTNMQNIVSNLMQGTGDVGIEALLQAGQQLAQQIQQTNPEFVENLRRQMATAPGGQAQGQTPPDTDSKKSEDGNGGSPE